MDDLTEPDARPRCCSSPTLISWMREGRAENYNRICDPGLEQRLDPEGLHLVTISILHEHKQGQLCAPHARIQILLKLVDSSEPHPIVMDISLQNLQNLSLVQPRA